MTHSQFRLQPLAHVEYRLCAYAEELKSIIILESDDNSPSALIPDAIASALDYQKIIICLLYRYPHNSILALISYPFFFIIFVTELQVQCWNILMLV